jgi:hypothetical protein
LKLVKGALGRPYSGDNPQPIASIKRREAHPKRRWCYVEGAHSIGAHCDALLQEKKLQQGLKKGDLVPKPEVSTSRQWGIHHFIRGGESKKRIQDCRGKMDR